MSFDRDARSRLRIEGQASEPEPRRRRPGRSQRPPEAVAPPRYLVDEDGKQVAVLVDIEQYRVLLEAAEELDAIRAYDAAKASGDEAIPFEQAIAEIEQERV